MTATGALIGSLLALAGTVLVAAIAAWQSRKASTDSPYGDMVQRVKDQDARIDQLQKDLDTLRSQTQEQVAEAQSEAADAKTEARESRNAAEQAVAENIVLVDHHLETVRAVATLKRPWPTPPYALRNRLTVDDYPNVPIIPDTA